MSDSQVDNGKRTWIIASSCAGAVGAGFAAVPFVGSFQPSERARAAGAAVEVDISALKSGEKMTVEWRGKPVWIIKRTPEQLAELPKVDALLADPKSARKPDELTPEYARNEARSRKPEVLVVVGICTHLGKGPSLWRLPVPPSTRHIGSKVPRVILWIAGLVAATAIRFITNFAHDARARGTRPFIVGVSILDDDAQCLVDARKVKWTHPPALRIGRAKHDHRVAKGELGVRDSARLVRAAHSAPEAKRLLEKGDRCRSIAVGQRRADESCDRHVRLRELGDPTSSRTARCQTGLKRLTFITEWLF